MILLIATLPQAFASQLGILLSHDATKNRLCLLTLNIEPLYRALVDATSKILWLQRLLKDMGVSLLYHSCPLQQSKRD